MPQVSRCSTWPGVMGVATFSVMSYIPVVLWRFCPLLLPASKFHFHLWGKWNSHIGLCNRAKLPDCLSEVWTMVHGRKEATGGNLHGYEWHLESFSEGFTLGSYHWFLLGWWGRDGYVIMLIWAMPAYAGYNLLCWRRHKNVAPSKSIESLGMTRRTLDLGFPCHFCAGQRIQIHHSCSLSSFLLSSDFLGEHCHVYNLRA